MSVVTEAAASFDASGDWAPDGATSAATWLARRCRLRKAQARALVRSGAGYSPTCLFCPGLVERGESTPPMSTPSPPPAPR